MRTGVEPWRPPRSRRSPERWPRRAPAAEWAKMKHRSVIGVDRRPLNSGTRPRRDQTHDHHLGPPPEADRAKRRSKARYY